MCCYLFFCSTCSRSRCVDQTFSEGANRTGPAAVAFDHDGADWWRGAIGDDVVDALPRKTSLWVGGNGSTTQAHYDVADNVLGQCLGTKRIRCWAPSSHWAMTPFPDAHPLARKAQVDVEAMPDPDLDVILEPGDALAIPAFWFHHCEARDLSASINTFFPAAHACVEIN